jgi:hypothetical protein
MKPIKSLAGLPTAFQRLTWGKLRRLLRPRYRNAIAIWQKEMIRRLALTTQGIVLENAAPSRPLRPWAHTTAHLAYTGHSADLRAITAQALARQMRFERAAKGAR